MSSALHLHIGGAGVMIGNSLWKLYQKEQKDVVNKNYVYEEHQHSECPRALFVDLDDRMIDQIRTEKIVNFKTQSFLSGKEDAANNFGRGYVTVGREFVDSFFELIRQQFIDCDKVDQIIITSSLSGGTGSGTLCRLLQKLSDNYPKINKNAFLLFPSINMSNNNVEIYNTLLSLGHGLLDNCNSIVMMDNESMYDVLNHYIELDFVDYSHLNNLVSQIISSYTGIQRFNNQSNQQIFSNQIPFPKLHFFTPSYGPIYDINNVNSRSKINIIQQRAPQLYNCQIPPKFISSALIYRTQCKDEYLNNKELASQNLMHNQSTFYQCDSKNYQILPQLAEIKQTQTVIAHDSAIFQNLNLILKKYKQQHANNSFIHWYCGEGVEAALFYECEDELKQLVKDYEEIYNLPVNEQNQLFI